MPRPRKADQLADIADLSCPERVVHVESVRRAREALPTGQTLAGVAEIFAALADPTRLRIVAALAAGELCVCDLAATVGQSESAISHQLRQLRGLGLVRPRRDGRRVYYALDDDHVTALYHQSLDHVGHVSHVSHVSQANQADLLSSSPTLNVAKSVGDRRVRTTQTG